MIASASGYDAPGSAQRTGISSAIPAMAPPALAADLRMETTHRQSANIPARMSRVDNIATTNQRALTAT